MRLRSSIAGAGSLYWTPAAGGNLDPGRRIAIDIPADDWATLEIPVNDPGGIGRVRLNMPPGKGEGEIQWIRVTGANGNVAREWTFD